MVEEKSKVAISRSKIGGEIPMVVSEIVDGVLYSGFFGTLDSARIRTITERILDLVVGAKASYLILDLGNVETIDSAVAAHLTKIVDSIRAVGSEVVFCGIPPVIAQTLVELGVNINLLVTKRDLKSALDHVYEKMGLALVKTK
jgi:rsbT co-antagonist protein RsbR